MSIFVVRRDLPTAMPPVSPAQSHKVYWGQSLSGAALRDSLKIAPVGAVILASLVVGCSGGVPLHDADARLVIFAAASLTDAFRDLSASFEAANPGVSVALNFSGSQRLRAQLEHGAGADLFASANREHVDAIASARLTRGEPADFAANRLVVITAAGYPGPATVAGLGNPGVKVVLAHPNVPVGQYTRTMLENLQSEPGYPQDFVQRVMANVVSEEPNVRRVAQKVALGDADAGVVYHSDAVSPDIAPLVRVAHAPDAANVVAEYPIVLLRDAGQPELARRFIEHLLSDAGQKALETHGFSPRPASKAVERRAAQPDTLPDALP